MTGHNSTASFDIIEPDAWETFALSLNKWGPKKLSKQWKTVNFLNLESGDVFQTFDIFSHSTI